MKPYYDGFCAVQSACVPWVVLSMYMYMPFNQGGGRPTVGGGSAGCSSGNDRKPARRVALAWMGA